MTYLYNAPSNATNKNMKDRYKHIYTIMIQFVWT